MATIYAFGTAPQVKAMGYDHLVRTIEGTEAQVLAKFEQQDVCLVQGPRRYGSLATYEFGVFERTGPGLTPGAPRARTGRKTINPRCEPPSQHQQPQGAMPMETKQEPLHRQLAALRSASEDDAWVIRAASERLAELEARFLGQPSNQELIDLADHMVQQRHWVKSDQKASRDNPRYRSMGETSWIRQDQLITFARAVRAFPQGLQEHPVSSKTLHFYRPLAAGNGVAWKYAGLCSPENRDWFLTQCREKTEYPFALGCEIVESYPQDCITTAQLDALVQERQRNEAPHPMKSESAQALTEAA